MALSRGGYFSLSRAGGKLCRACRSSVPNCLHAHTHISGVIPPSCQCACFQALIRSHACIHTQAGCSSVPDVAAFELTERDQFLILGCDGFWGAWDAQGCVDAAAELLSASERGSGGGGGGGGDAEKSITNRLLNIAVRERGAKDNCSVILIRFQRGGS